MKNMKLSTVWLYAAILIVTVTANAQTAFSDNKFEYLATINVANAEELYSAVNNPANAGNQIVIAAGVYTLSVNDSGGAARPNGGRLELQENMALRGVGGNRNGIWWTLNLSNNQINTNQFGISTDKPVIADYDGDGRADQAVFRNGEWHLNRSSQGYAVVNFGLATDKPVIGDYDGDGKTDLAIYRNGTWFVLQSSNGVTQFQFGLATDKPVIGDYDGDGKTDAAVYRNGTWYLRQTTNGISVQQFGLANDKPVPVAFLP